MTFRSRALAGAVLAVAALASAAPLGDADRIARAQAYAAAVSARDFDKARAMLAPDARVWHEKKEGPGDPLRPGGGRWAHWDAYFHGATTYSDWRVEGGAVVATARETNDFYRLLDWKPGPMRFTWWVDGEGRVAGFMVMALPETEPTGSRLKDAIAWAKEKHPDQIAYLMPKGSLDPTGDRANRWERLLVEWRKVAGLPEVAIAPR